MPYSELIKSFDKIREYMRQFYVYGFRSRSEYDAKSARSYDNERRRIESWLGDYMSFRQDEGGKAIFLSVDSRTLPHNPLYAAFKTKSFTANDIALHFYILDMLADGEELTLRQIADRVSEYREAFDDAEPTDDSTIRNKLKEYSSLGLLESEKHGRELVYRRVDDGVDLCSWEDAIAFFSEADPVGVIGSYLLDKLRSQPNEFSFKHHYILHALDSEVLCELLLAMGEDRCVELSNFSRRLRDIKKHNVFPAKIYVSTQSGRQYLLCYHYIYHRPMLFRLDNIRAVKPGSVERSKEKYLGFCEKFEEHLWGASGGEEPNLDHIEMTVRVGDDERFILDRLEREKRCGRIEAIDSHTYRYVADVYDASEMLPWLRTFIGRVEKLTCSDSWVERRFYQDIEAMEALYGGESDAVQ